MKKILVGLLLVSSALSFAATQRVPLEKFGTRENGRILYLEGQEKPYSGEVERKYPDGKYFLLDEDEYNQNKARYQYGEKIDKILKYNVNKLQEWIDKNHGALAPDFADVWLENYEKIMGEDQNVRR